MPGAVPARCPERRDRDAAPELGPVGDGVDAGCEATSFATSPMLPDDRRTKLLRPQPNATLGEPTRPMERLGPSLPDAARTSGAALAAPRAAVRDASFLQSDQESTEVFEQGDRGDANELECCVRVADDVPESHTSDSSSPRPSIGSIRCNLTPG